MITARTPYQIYKSEEESATVAEFSSLAADVALPYKIRAAEETLNSSLEFIAESEENKTKYAISILHSAGQYLDHLGCYLPLLTRSLTAEKLVINFHAILTVLSQYSPEAQALVKLSALAAEPSKVTTADLREVEDAIDAAEKELRQKAKDAGNKVEMLRKVAPEPVAKLQTSPSSAAGPGQGDDEGGLAGDPHASRSPSRRRQRAGGDGAEGEGGTVDEDGQPLKSQRTEIAGTAKRSAAAKRQTKTAQLVWGRLRALTTGEKKGVAVLQSMIQILAHIYATKCNELLPVFDYLSARVDALEAIIQAERESYEAKEDKKPPEPFHEVALDDLKQRLEESSLTFRDDEDCRFELDEDLLFPIAHACLCLVNQIEGFDTQPFEEPSEEQVQRKQEARDAAREKRESAHRRILERARAKEKLAQKREEEKRVLRQQLGLDVEEEELEEDTRLKNPSALGYIRYDATLPLGSVALFEKALFVWSMITSIPRPLSLSQMRFETFLTGLQYESEDTNGLMEAITRCLLDVSMAAFAVNSPNTPRITTRGKNWFDALKEFVGVASGNKKKRQQQRRKQEETSSGEEDEEEEDDSDDSSSSVDEDDESSSTSKDQTGEEESNSSKNTEEEKETGSSSKVEVGPPDEGPAKPDAEENREGGDDTDENEEGDADPFAQELAQTMRCIEELRNRATWGNVSVGDRLNLLKFCVMEALLSNEVREDAEELLKQYDEKSQATDKRLKDVREDAERELKALLRSLPTSVPSVAKKRRKVKKDAMKEEEGEEDNPEEGASEEKKEEDFETKRAAVLKAAEIGRQKAYANLYKQQDGKDIGAIIEPIGQDRYGRVYWRFPMQQEVYVQTASSTRQPFPVLDIPADLAAKRKACGNALLDDEAEEEAVLALNGTSQSSSVEPQRAWGVIPRDYLADFAATLDGRGEREAVLKHKLDHLAPYLDKIDLPLEVRSTRSRTNMFGYINRMKIDFF